jgi:nucleoside-diphosphate-sugar epimerase
MTRILITGCCGVLGENLVQHLFQKGEYDIVGFDLYPAKDTLLHQMTFIQGDITKFQEVKAAMHEIDIVIHAASASPAYHEKKITNIVVTGTRILLEQAELQKIDRFIYISSTAVYGIPERMPMRETDPIQPYHDPYNRAKAAAEKVCLEYREQGLCLPILRPRTFLGPNRLGTFAMLFEWAQEGRHFPILGKGHNRYQFLDVVDLCEAIYLAMKGKQKLVNDTFNIGAQEFGSMKESYQAVLTDAGFGKKIRCIPAAPAMLLLDFLSKLKLTPLYKRLYRKVHLDYYVSTEKAERVLGFVAQYSNTQTLVRSYRWYCEHQTVIEATPGTRNNAKWNQGILRYAKFFF